MFKTGDKVVIVNKYNTAMPNSPVINLEGTIATVTEAVQVGDRDPFYAEAYVRYKLHFEDIKAKKPDLYEPEQQSICWTDRHLEPYDDKDYETDVMSILEA